MGRYRKPFSQQLVDGDTRRRGARKSTEDWRPDAGTAIPKCPNNLSQRAREIFEFSAAEMAEMNLVGRVDVFVLAALATAYADIDDLREEVEKLKCAKQTRDTRAAIGRLERAEDRKWTRVLQASDRLGLSPRSRENLSTEKSEKNPEESLMEILSKPRIRRAPITTDQSQ
jgi:P27 family predicted phage terminase small subunit